MMLALDDGIANGNFNAADVCFLLGMIFGLLAVIVSFIRSDRRHPAGVDAPPPARGYISPWAAPLGWLAVASIAFGLFLL